MKVRDGLFETMAVMPYKLQRGKWYRCKFSLFNVGEVMLLQGKVWAAEEIEPLNWQITAEDGSNPLRHGNAGFWTGHSEAIFSELVLTDSDEMVLYSEDFQGVSKGVVPPSFTTIGGKWFIDRDDGFHVLRQISEKPNINFDEAHYEWMKNKIRVKSKITGLDGIYRYKRQSTRSSAIKPQKSSEENSF